MKKYLLIPFVALAVNSYAATATKPMQAVAKLAASCTMTVTNLNFNILMTPLTSQSSSGTMKVLCNNGTPYTVGMAYGGVYGTGAGKGSWFQPTGGNNYDVYVNGAKVNTVNFTKSPDNYTTSYNPNNKCSTAGDGNCYWVAPGYAYGMLKGASHGDSVAYSIALPGDATKVWNSGQESYKATGNGLQQTISVNGKIVPSSSPLSYPAPDVYTDTVTATLTY